LKLQSVHLVNIRSHTQTLVHFSNGFNCLVGGLGQGKSSVLYAFDFVLFGDPLGRSYEYLLREDAEEGKVTANFVHNGKKYKIQRALKRHGSNIGQDIDQLKLIRDGKLVASHKNDAVAEELKVLTGLDKNIFREVVWIRQEHLKELIDTTPRQRQKKIDELFGLSDYETSWTALQLFQRTYEGEKNALERDVDVIRVQKLEDDYCNAVEDFSSIVIQIEDAKQKLATAKSVLNDATSHLEGLEELRKTTEVLQRREVQLCTNLTNVRRRYSDLVDQNETSIRRIEEQEQQIAQIETQKNLYLNSLEKAGLDKNKTLEDLRTYLFDVEEKLRTFSGEQEATKREMQALTSKISSIMTENKCPRCLQELTGDYKKSLKDTLQKEQVENQKRLSELQTKLDQLTSHHTIVYVAVSNLQQLIPRIGDLRKQVTEKRELLAKFSVQLEDVKRDEKHLQNQLSEIQAEITKFDVSSLESARRMEKEAFVNHLGAKNEVTSLERRKTDLALKVDGLKDRLDLVQAKVERKESLGRLLEVIDGIRGAYRSIQPKLRGEFVTYLQLSVQQVLDNLTGDVGSSLNVKIDKDYSPFVSSGEGYVRDVANLSGGERTLLAFAYRIGLGQLIMLSKTGHGLYMLLLDEPTESLGREDGSVERLAEAVSRLKAIEQIIAVTHNESFAEKAEHIIRIQKESGASQAYIEK
jgi:DNA repair protein SbcC/Rad50